MINAKLRFEILKRDWFRCHYCWKEGKDVSLEIDHIVPKSRWWDDSPDNLITCCRECNMWKGNRWLNKSELWKDKITDTKTSIKRQWTRKWNLAWLWTINNNTYVLLCKYIDIVFESYRNPLYYINLDMVYKKIWNKEEQDYDYLLNEFKKWWDFCSSVLKYSSEDILEYLENILLLEVMDDDWWTWGKKVSDEWIWDYRLNYLLSRELTQYIEWPNKDSKKTWLYYFVLKYSYRKDLMPSRFNWWL